MIPGVSATEACVTALSQRLTTRDVAPLLPPCSYALLETVLQVPEHEFRYRSIAIRSLFYLHGYSLLESRDVRRLLVRRATDEELVALYRFDPSGRFHRRRDLEESVVTRPWKPGGRWASHFLSVLGLPRQLAPQKAQQRIPSEEVLSPSYPLPELHPFQRALLPRLETVLCSSRSPARRAILSLPTGAGKTRLAMEAIVGEFLRSPSPRGIFLWLTPSEELCVQAEIALREVWSDQTYRLSRERRSVWPARLARLYAKHDLESDLTGGFIVATLQKVRSLARRSEEAVVALRDSLRAVVLDEAHQATAPSYLEALNCLGVGPQCGEDGPPFIGLTATPYRVDRGESAMLVELFRGALVTPDWEDPIGELRDLGILSAVDIRTVRPPCTMQDPSRDNHYSPEWEEGVNSTILRELLALPDDWPTLIFTNSLPQAHHLALMLRLNGRQAASISHDSGSGLRSSTLEDFRSGSVQIICNFGLLTTGFDAPGVRCVVVARSTTSPLLYEQMIGRGMRGPANGGTDRCLIIDVEDGAGWFQGQMSYTRYQDLWRRSA